MLDANDMHNVQVLCKAEAKSQIQPMVVVSKRIDQDLLTLQSKYDALNSQLARITDKVQVLVLQAEAKDILKTPVRHFKDEEPPSKPKP